MKRWIQRACLSLSMVLLAVPAAGAQWQFELLRETTTPLSNPHDIKLAPDGRHLFVSDVGGDQVVVLDRMSLERVDAFGGAELDGTHDVDFDQAGRAYVADTHNGRVAIYALTGTRGSLVGELSDRLSGPEGVLVHPNGLIYVGGAWSNNVVAFRDGEVVHELKGLSAPHDLELNTDGRIWLADSGNNRILLLSETLEIVAELRGAPYHFDGVRYLDVLPDGTLLAADKYSHTLKVIGPGRDVVATIGDGQNGVERGFLKTPEGVDSEGDLLWLSDSGNDRVLLFRMRR